MMRRFEAIRKAENLLFPAAGLAIGVFLAAGEYLAARQPPDVSRDHRPSQVHLDGYQSSDGCRACHPSQYASWHASYHRTMTQLATPQSIATSFDNVVVEAAPGGPMRLERRGQELWAEFADPDAAGQTPVPPPPRISRQVVMTTGSHNQQIFWYATGNSRVLGQLPAIWLTAEQTWIPRRAAIMAPPSAAH
jgi:hypothetical protein